MGLRVDGGGEGLGVREGLSGRQQLKAIMQLLYKGRAVEDSRKRE